MIAPDYAEVLRRKVVRARPRGMENVPALNSALWPWQRDVTEFLLRGGRGAGFMDTGTGKTGVTLEWARVVAEHTGLPVLVFCPLAVAPQHLREARTRFGIDDVRVVRSADELGPGINLTNYERLHLFEDAALGGLALDESSILKSFSGATTRKLMAFGDRLDWRAAFTATPAPNDHTELGQHSQFLGVMNSAEMLSRWFINDQRHMANYRLKWHAVADYWSWVGSWARCLSRPSDLGYPDAGFVLSDLIEEVLRVRADVTVEPGEDKDGQLRLLRAPGTSATALHKEKRQTAAARAAAVAEIVNDVRDEPWIVWCDTDYEADELTARIPGAVEVRGSMPPETKEERLDAFTTGALRVLVTKPRIAGFGLNWQHCAHMAFVGASYSYEQRYQAIRRCWRFGQRRPVTVFTAVADTERPVLEAVRAKEAAHQQMKEAMAAAMRRASHERGVKIDYVPTLAPALPAWLAGQTKEGFTHAR